MMMGEIPFILPIFPPEGTRPRYVSIHRRTAETKFFFPFPFRSFMRRSLITLYCVT
jgi:hypothetical protein